MTEEAAAQLGYPWLMYVGCRWKVHFVLRMFEHKITTVSATSNISFSMKQFILFYSLNTDQICVWFFMCNTKFWESPFLLPVSFG